MKDDAKKMVVKKCQIICELAIKRFAEAAALEDWHGVMNVQQELCMQMVTAADMLVTAAAVDADPVQLARFTAEIPRYEEDMARQLADTTAL
jgi:hypothetical protein